MPVGGRHAQAGFAVGGELLQLGDRSERPEASRASDFLHADMLSEVVKNEASRER